MGIKKENQLEDKQQMPKDEEKIHMAIVTNLMLIISDLLDPKMNIKTKPNKLHTHILLLIYYFTHTVFKRWLSCETMMPDYRQLYNWFGDAHYYFQYFYTTSVTKHQHCLHSERVATVNIRRRGIKKKSER